MYISSLLFLDLSCNFKIIDELANRKTTKETNESKSN